MTRAQVDALSTQTFYNTEQKNGTTVVLPAGVRVTDVYGPARQVVLADGTEVIARPHTATLYDQGAPNSAINPATGQRYSLPTTVTVTATTGIGADIETISTTTTGYNKIDTTDAAEGDGWALGLATTTTTGGITGTTRYDTLGRVTETRQPLSTGTDAGTTKTTYYTASAPTGADPACVNRPEWAGLTCRTYPAAAPSSGPTLPATATTGYSMWLAPTTIVETSGGATRTSTTSYDTAGRAVSSKTTTSGLAGSTARPGSYTKYRTDTGLVDYTGWLNTAGTDADTAGRTTTSYDRWGRATTVVGDAGTVTTTYDGAGRVAKVVDAKGITSYGYDGLGERRGLPTTLTVTRAGTGGTLTWTATYDREGRIVQQRLPGRVTQVTDYDEAGEPVALSYLGQVTPVTVSTDPNTGEPTYTPGTPLQDQPWMTWTTLNDVTGRVRFQATGTGAAFDEGSGVTTIDDVTDWTAQALGEAASYGREYRYDTAGRLTSPATSRPPPTRPGKASPPLAPNGATPSTRTADAPTSPPPPTRTATAPPAAQPTRSPRPVGTPPTVPLPAAADLAPTSTTCSDGRRVSPPSTPQVPRTATSHSATTTTTYPAPSPKATPAPPSPWTRTAAAPPRP